MMESLVLTLGNIHAKGIDISMDGNGKVYLDLNVRPAVVTVAPDSAAGTLKARPVDITSDGVSWVGEELTVSYNWGAPESTELPSYPTPNVGDIGIIVDSKYFIPFSNTSYIMEGSEYTVTELTRDGVILVANGATLPVGVLTASGKYYPIEKGSLNKVTDGWEINIASYLAYDNTSEFQPPWKIYCSGGTKGDDGLSFSPDARGLTTELSLYADEDKGFTFFNLEDKKFYFKMSASTGDWSSVSLSGERGADGEDGQDGHDGQDGITPHIGANGNWYIGNTDTGYPSTGAAGVNGKDGKDGEDGKNGTTFIPHVSDTGVISWSNVDGLENPAEVSIKGPPGKDGQDGKDGVNGKDGASGITPHIGDNGHWYIDTTDTGIAAKGDTGESGILESTKIVVDTAINNNKIEIPINQFPVAVQTQRGSVYPIEKSTLTATATHWVLDITAYLAYDNVTSFVATWTVFCAGGVKGDSFVVDARGRHADISLYDSEKKGFSFLDIDSNTIYYKLEDTAGSWSDGFYMNGSVRLVDVTPPDTVDSLAYTMSTGEYAYMDKNKTITELSLTIDSNSNNSSFRFNTNPDSEFRFTLTCSSEFYINNLFDFLAGRSYIIVVDNNTILWEEVSVL